MLESLRHLISQKGFIIEPKDPLVITVEDESAGMVLTKDILYHMIDKKTLLLLSGGKTPKALYEQLAKEEKLVPGAVGLIDERYGKKMHLDSNEWMLQQTGLLGYLNYQHSPFYAILQDDGDSSETTIQYDETLRFLFNGFQKSVGILGIGVDGHTAGIPINTSLDTKDQSLVTFFPDFPGAQKERISMTFLGLSMLDFMMVLVFGQDKKEALQNMFADGSEKEIPARFFKRPEIAQKTLLITDQVL